ncbi:MAG: hypothetical protein GY737_13120 [Desulfobacteraceae bacterium]|nr:hypothetical protein [Desulfobacteraceae bacterium]
MMKISNEHPKGKMETGGQADNRSKADLSDQARLFSALMAGRGKPEQEPGNPGCSQGSDPGHSDGRSRQRRDLVNEWEEQDD